MSVDRSHIAHRFASERDESLPRMLSPERRRAAAVAPAPLAFHLQQGLKGFLGGSLIVVPAVLWFSGTLSDLGTEPAPVRTPAVVISQVAVRPLAAAEITGSTAPEARLEPASLAGTPSVAAAPAPVAGPAIAGRLEHARDLVLAGNVIGARDILSEPAMATSAEAAYVLAETYDPNVLAALGLAGVRAEPDRARSLYEQAVAGGIGSARNRLEALE